MKKQTYFQTMVRRQDFITETLLNFFLSFCSWPRMLLEMFIRRNQGERYFSFAGALMLLTLLAVAPFISLQDFIPFLPYDWSPYRFRWSTFLSEYLTWYLYLAAFGYMVIQRRQEIKQLPSVFDFKRYSLSTGLIHPRFYLIEWNGRYFSRRMIETVLEPGLFFLPGVLLWIIGQPIGMVLTVSSIFYSLSYAAAYRAGDNFLMDKIDERICQEDLASIFVDGLDANSGRGFHFYGRIPATRDARERVADLFTQSDETVEAV